MNKIKNCSHDKSSQDGRYSMWCSNKVYSVSLLFTIGMFLYVVSLNLMLKFFSFIKGRSHCNA